MTTRDAFLADIIANPADDTPRLIYADWLDEQGEAERGEFIRVQCEIAQAEQAIEKLSKDQFLILPESRLGQHIEWIRGELSKLRKRERELLREDGPLRETFDRYFSTPEGTGFWIGESCFYAVFCRGFVSSLTCTAADFLAHADAITAAQPIERVELTTWPITYVSRNGGTLNSEEAVKKATLESPGMAPVSYPSPPDIIESLLSKRWHRITFTLPPASFIEGLSPLTSAAQWTDADEATRHHSF